MWAACPCPTANALLLLLDFVLQCEQLALALWRTCYLLLCVSSLLLPYGILVTTITLLLITLWAACPCPTAYALKLLHDSVLLGEQLALVLRHTRYYYNVLLCEQAALALHVTSIKWLCTTLWAALRHTRYYYYMTTYYFVSSLPLPYGIRGTTITWQPTTVWAACPCPMAYTLLLLHNYVLLCEQPALALLHTHYYYYITTYYCVSSLPLPYGIRVTTITLLRTTVYVVK